MHKPVRCLPHSLPPACHKGLQYDTPLKGNRVPGLSMIVVRIFLFSAILLATRVGIADPANTPERDATGPGIWWNWDVSREWSSKHRLAKGAVKLYADAQKTQALKVESLRFSLELDCPISAGTELVINEAHDASELGAEVRCNIGSPGKFEARWRFEAIDSRFGSVSEQGTVQK